MTAMTSHRRHSVQSAYVGIEAITGDVLHLPEGRTRAILEVGALPFDLLDEGEQAAVVAGFAQVLDSLTHPVQLLARVVRLDLDRYLGDLEERARREPSDRLRALLRDQIAHLRKTAREQVLLERRFYLVVPGEHDSSSAGRALLRRGTAGATGGAARQRLAFRCDELTRLLRGCNLPCERLSGPAIAQLLYTCWCPERAAVQPLRDLDAYTLPVVEGTRPRQQEANHMRTADPTRGSGRMTANGLLRDERPGGERGLHPDVAQFARGLRSVADLIAPDAVEKGRSWLRLDESYTRTLALTALPAEVGNGWLGQLIGFEEPLELSIHITPLDSARMVRAYTNRLARHQGTLNLDARQERVADAEITIAHDQLLRLRHRLAAGEQRVYSAGIYLLLRARTPIALDELTARVEGLVDGMLAQSRRSTFEHDSGFRSCLPTGEDRLRRPRNINTDGLAAAFPFTGGSLSMGQGIVFGRAPRAHGLVILDLFDQGEGNRENFNANLAVFGKPGGGKSFFTKLIALRSLTQAGVDFVVIDPEPREEYRALCEAVGGQYVRLALGEGHTLNPFDLPPSVEGSDPLAEQVVELGGLLEVLLDDRGQRLGSRERAVLDEALYATYAAAGIVPGDPASWEREPPLLGDLRATLLAVPTDQRSARSVALDLAQRLSRWTGDGALATLFDRPTNVDLAGHFIVFSIGGLARELHPVAIHAIAGFVWRQVRREWVALATRPRMLVIDEAWKLLRHEAGARFLEEFARQARKYYLSLVTITQDVEDFLNNEHGRTVLKMASAKFLMRQDGATIGPVADFFGLTADEAHLLQRASKGAGLLYALGSHVALQVEASPEEYALVTTAPQDLIAAQAASRAVAQADAAHPGLAVTTDGHDALAGRATERDAIRALLRGTGGRR